MMLQGWIETPTGTPQTITRLCLTHKQVCTSTVDTVVIDIVYNSIDAVSAYPAGCSYVLRTQYDNLVPEWLEALLNELSIP